ncbi:hypothetical protein AB434_1447 [Heyndrickxia coagulans]|uniref:Uncharacterized protein n=1 Tax=Heyndrickxia coagulans TaxID=1398 RepID=A0AAN0T9J6_HEYCO|nr:hypothetical protein SB48_HM08orf06205 [Heyndrickxia coagulans]AKN53852.1 hypothetical protein AB434_1447 [Heyndrickxia coagulans]KYC60656.1 hypothetical protein B4100_1146 [Heyndrickxia coagulans]KYC85922.1 hypothetical protein B4096_1087 [Heyndrickxia coagulans]
MRKKSVRRKTFPLLLLHEMKKRNVCTGLGISKLVRRT